jgi:hypothetical protein
MVCKSLKTSLEPPQITHAMDTIFALWVAGAAAAVEPAAASLLRIRLGLIPIQCPRLLFMVTFIGGLDPGLVCLKVHRQAMATRKLHYEMYIADGV